MNKTCAKCNTEKPIAEYIHAPRNADGLNSYCRECCLENVMFSKLRDRKNSYHRDGFLSEEDHFNYALRHYSTIFNTPSLLKHLTNTGSIQRYDNNANPL